MLEACRVAFNVPSYDNVAATVDFQCSGKSQEYSSCLQEVFAMCRDKNGFISTQMNASLELLENQTPLICSKDNTDLMKCTAMFPKISGFQDCITGVTLNKTVDPIDVCRYFETTMGCSTKYTDLMCPQNLNTLQNTTRVPQSCTQSMGGIQEETSCDFNMLEACQVAYGLPSSSGSDAGESLYDFICSGRLQQYITCAQKVNTMCSSQGVDVSAIVNSVLFYQRQSALTCSDKTGFIDYTNCTQRYLRSDDFVNCLSTANSFDTCGTTIAAYKCNLNAIRKECPATEVYYKKFIYNSLKDCNATYTIDIPLSVVSSSSPELSVKDFEMIAKVEYDKVVEKHSKDMLFLQEEYEKRLESLVESLKQMEQNQQLHQQQILKQQQQISDQQKLMAQRRAQSPGLSPQTTLAPPATPKKSAESSEVSRPVIHAPMPPQKPRTKGPRKKPTPVQKTWDGVPSEFLERLQYFEDESYRHKIELIEKTRREIQDDIEKKLAGQHKLSRRDQEMYEALNDVSLPALFMPFQRGSVFNPRAHQYFHPTGSTDLRLTQPPSVFQLPPLSKNSSSILNLFELSKNFNSRNQGWLMDRYIQQQEPVKNVHGMIPQTTMPTSQMRSPSAPYTPQPTYDIPPTREEEYRQRTMEAEAEC